jgi:hypothetical protein
MQVIMDCGKESENESSERRLHFDGRIETAPASIRLRFSAKTTGAARIIFLRLLNHAAIFELRTFAAPPGGPQARLGGLAASRHQQPIQPSPFTPRAHMRGTQAECSER